MGDIIDFKKPKETEIRLQNTVHFMCSNDYIERFKAEYFQTLIRYRKLLEIVFNYGHLPFKPKSSLEILKRQLEVMCEYLNVLEDRAEIEGIDLSLNQPIE